MSHLLTTEETAERLRLHPRTVRRLCRRGDLAGAVQVGRQWRIPISAVDGALVPLAPVGRGFAVADGEGDDE